MKKILAILLIISTLSANACEICGCGNGSFYMGLLPQFSKGFVETRYNYFTFDTKLAADATQFSHNTYQTIELWGGYNITKKWQVLVVLPYHINKEVSDDGMTDIKGFGDVTILSNYQIFESKKLKGNNTIGQQIWLGGGVKLATGDSHVDLNNPDNTVGTFNSKLGTGTYDFLVNLMYKYSFNDLGVVASAQYKIDGTNSDNFKFGNRFYANAFAFYRINVAKSLKITPNVGVLYEKSAGNVLNNVAVAQTGGYMASTSLGLEFNVKKIGFGYNVQIPVLQNFAEGQTTANIRHGVHLSFAF